MELGYNIHLKAHDVGLFPYKDLTTRSFCFVMNYRTKNRLTTHLISIIFFYSCHYVETQIYQVHDPGTWILIFNAQMGLLNSSLSQQQKRSFNLLFQAVEWDRILSLHWEFYIVWPTHVQCVYERYKACFHLRLQLWITEEWVRLVANGWEVVIQFRLCFRCSLFLLLSGAPYSCCCLLHIHCCWWHVCSKRLAPSLHKMQLLSTESFSVELYKKLCFPL